MKRNAQDSEVQASLDNAVTQLQDLLLQLKLNNNLKKLQRSLAQYTESQNEPVRHAGWRAGTVTGVFGR